MKIGMVGLGRMGANMARRLMRDGHDCVVFDLDAENVKELENEGAVGSKSIADLCTKLDGPRAVWVMVPAGAATEATIDELSQSLTRDDIVIDGGNTMFKDDVRRAEALSAQGINYVDVGTSGGVWGLERGYCLMVGGEKSVVQHLDPILKTLAPGRGDIPRTPGVVEGETTAEEGYLHCGPVGAGHFVKMVHNGIEYGVMQAYAEGFDILKGSNTEQLPENIRYDLPMPAIAEVWRRGSVIGSWLLDLTSAALQDDPTLSSYTGHVQDSGEGRWTVNAAIEEAVPAEVITAALFARFRSRQEHTFAEKVLSAMRHQFGGHVEVNA